MAKKTSIVCIANQKGGVAKTTTAVNLAACWAKSGKRVLLIDMDGQANATRWLNLRKLVKSFKEKTISNGLLNPRLKVEDLVFRTADSNLDVLASEMTLTRIARERIANPNSGLMLERFLDRSDLDYDIVVIDTHPALDLLFQNAMNVAHYYIIPLKPEIDPLEGCDYMFDDLETIKEHNGTLHFLGFVVTDYDAKIKTHRILLPEIQKYAKSIKHPVLGVTPHSGAVASSANNCEPLAWRKDNLPVTAAYKALSERLLPELRGARRGVPQASPRAGLMPDIFTRSDIIDSMSVN